MAIHLGIPYSRHWRAATPEVESGVQKALVLMLLTGCGGCGADERVEGPHPYVRCALREPVLETEAIGEVELSLDGRILDVRGLTEASAFAVGEGSLAELPAGPVVVIGGFARNESLAERVAEALGDRLALLLAGGEDDPEIIDDVFDADNFIDLRGVHVIALESWDWVVLPGAADGRYALGDEACGYGDADVEALRETLEGRDRPRMWLSWNAPANVADLGFEGVHVGDPRLDLATGGLFAFPATTSGTNAAEGLEHAVSVPRWGGFNERYDGTPVAPGVLEVQVRDEGLRSTYRPL